MTKFAQLNGMTSIKLTSTLITLTLSVITANAAHAEKYCKSIDQNGNASYILAPATGCKKKFKTVGVSQFKGTVTPVTTNTEQNKSTSTPTTANPVTSAAGSNTAVSKSATAS